MSTIEFGYRDLVKEREQLQYDHPYAKDSRINLGHRISCQFDSDVERIGDLLTEHREEPYDLFVGEDVSGRIPALVVNSVFGLAHTAGQIDTRPPLIFMASGPIDGINLYNRTPSETETEWANNLRQHASRIFGEQSLNKALVISEVICRGESSSRIINALSGAGVDEVETFEMRGYPYLAPRQYADDRRAVGVEKKNTNPTSKRHPEFDGYEAGRLRLFIQDYAKALFKFISR